MREDWAEPTRTAPCPIAEYMEGLQKALETAWALAHRNLEAAQNQQKWYYDRSLGSVKEGNLVLVCGTLFPTSPAVPWVRPFPITRVLGPYTYEVWCGPRPAQR